MTQKSTPINTVYQIINKSLDMYKKGYRTFISMGLLFGFLNVLQSFLVTESSSLVSVVFMFASSWLSLTVIYVCLLVEKNEVRGFRDILLMPRERFIDFILTDLTYLMLILVGFMVLVIPGIYCALIFVVADIVVVMEGKRIPDVFKRSAELVKGNIWTVLLFNCAVSLFAMFLMFGAGKGIDGGFHLGKMMTLILSVFVYPFVNIAKLQLYLFLVKNKANMV